MTLQHIPSMRAEEPLSPRRGLRVAVVTETYPPEVNGVAATVSRIVEGLHSRGHLLQVLRPHQGESDGVPDAAGLAHRRLRGLPIPRYPGLRLGLPAQRRLQALWAGQRPDVVHVVTEGPLGWSATRAAMRLGLPLVSDFRTNFHAYSAHYGMAWLGAPILAYLRRLHNRCACTMVPTEAVRGELQAQGFERLRVVSRGVDRQRFDPARRSAGLRSHWGADSDDPVALYVGRLAPEKNLGVMLQAFQAMKAVDPRWRLVLVGDGPELRSLQQRCPDAIFAGVRHAEDLAAHYASADLFLFPSLTETFGNLVPEALASGLPLIAYEQAAAAQLLQSAPDGQLVKPGDGLGFVAAARDLAQDTARRIRLAAGARDRTALMGWSVVVEAVEAEYLAAIAARYSPSALGPQDADRQRVGQ